MKNIFIVSFLFVSIGIFSQELKYEDVVKVDSTATKDELYNRARTWFSKEFKSEKDVISVEDKASGEISGNGAIRYDPSSFYFGADCARGYITYKINIYLKDGRYKYSIHSFRHEGTYCPGGGITSYGVLTESEKPLKGPKKGWNEVKERAKKYALKTIESLKEAMNKKHETNNNW